MQATTKVLSVRLSSEDERIYNELLEKLGESPSQLIRRSLNALYYLTLERVSDKT